MPLTAARSVGLGRRLRGGAGRAARRHEIARRTRPCQGRCKFMAACGAMNRKIGVLATIAALVLVAGCSNVIDGRAVISAPRPGSPIQWAPCKAASSDETRLPAGAECGMLSVPVDYSKADGDVAQIAMIRFKATGEKIGSLVVNPGGPGESGVEAAASLAPTLPQSVRGRFDLVGFDPRGVAN